MLCQNTKDPHFRLQILSRSALRHQDALRLLETPAIRTRRRPNERRARPPAERASRNSPTSFAEFQFAAHQISRRRRMRNCVFFALAVAGAVLAAPSQWGLSQKPRAGWLHKAHAWLCSRHPQHRWCQHSGQQDEEAPSSSGEGEPLVTVDGEPSEQPDAIKADVEHREQIENEIIKREQIQHPASGAKPSIVDIEYQSYRAPQFTNHAQEEHHTERSAGDGCKHPGCELCNLDVHSSLYPPLYHECFD